MNQKDAYSVRWYNSLLFRTPLLFLLLLAVLVLSLTIIMDTIGRPRMEEQSFRMVNQVGSTMVARLGERLAVAETLARALATTGASLPLDAAEHMRIVPRLIDELGPSSYIIGGGVWYEPFAFDADHERRSFFWGRDAEGALQMVKDYDDPRSPGYHREEWYVPGRFLGANQVFWSKSYVDPHTFVPMVTCTAPVYRHGRFAGVVTVDLKLAGLEAFFDAQAKKISGYAFAVDRNGKFLSFPDVNLTRLSKRDKLGHQHIEYILARDLAAKHPRFAPLASALHDSSNELLKQAKQSDLYDPEIARIVARDSTGVSATEAELIAAVLQGTRLNTTDDDLLLKHFTTGDDLLLKEPCSVAIFHVPGTYWQIVTVTPVSHAMSAATAIYHALLVALIICVSAAVIGAFLALNNMLMRPLARITQQLKSAVDINAEEMLCLDENFRNEFGTFAYWFNVRTRKLADALEQLRVVRGELEQRVAERTETLAQTNIKLELEVQQRRRAQQFLRRLAMLDPLTDIANRRSFDATLPSFWQRAKQKGTPLALILVDMDQFKQFNNIYGYQAGDQCLKKIAQTMAESTRGDEERIARFGGEQFAVILPDSDSDAAYPLAEKIRSEVEALQIPHKGDGTCGVVTVSVGVGSMQPDKNNNYEQLIARTNQALYLAKSQGRNRVVTDKDIPG
jgi:diguanylate cyclase (GGDEF)-like protein